MNRGGKVEDKELPCSNGLHEPTKQEGRKNPRHLAVGSPDRSLPCPVTTRPKRTALAGTRRARVPRPNAPRDDVLAPAMEGHNLGRRHQLDHVRTLSRALRRFLDRDESVSCDA